MAKTTIKKQLAELTALVEEMDNPLTAIYMRLHSLRKALNKGDVKSQIEVLESLQRNVHRLDVVVKGLLQNLGHVLEPGDRNRTRRK